MAWIEEKRSEAERLELMGRLDAVLEGVAEKYRCTHGTTGLEEEVFTTQQAATRERVSTRTINDRCLRGEYPGAYRTQGNTGHWRIPISGIFLRREGLRSVSLPDPVECDVERDEAVRKDDPTGSSEWQDIPDYLDTDPT